MEISILKENLKNRSPVFFRKIVRKVFKKARNLRNIYYNSILKKRITKKDILTQLINCGVKKGDTLFVHSSLSRIGRVEGGSKTILDALLEAVGSEGTVGAPTFWGSTSIYLDGNTVYDVCNSPSILGSLTEKIRNYKGAKRSFSPSHSAAFIGNNAEYLTKNHHLDITPFYLNSPYLKMIKIKAKIVLIGVSLEYMTSFHTIEDIIPNFPYKVYYKEPINFTIIDPNRNKISVKTFVHCPEVGRQRQCLKMEKYLNEAGIIIKKRLGLGEVKIIEAAKLHYTLKDLYKKGITMYNPK